MKPMAQAIEQAHALYGQLTGQTLRLAFGRERAWYEWLRAGFTLEELRQAEGTNVWAAGSPGGSAIGLFTTGGLGGLLTRAARGPSAELEQSSRSLLHVHSRAAVSPIRGGGVVPVHLPGTGRLADFLPHRELALLKDQRVIAI